MAVPGDHGDAGQDRAKRPALGRRLLVTRFAELVERQSDSRARRMF